MHAQQAASVAAVRAQQANTQAHGAYTAAHGSIIRQQDGPAAHAGPVTIVLGGPQGGLDPAVGAAETIAAGADPARRAEAVADGPARLGTPLPEQAQQHRTTPSTPTAVYIYMLV